MTILEQIAATHSKFRPSNPTDFFALSLAYRLGDPGGAAHYASIASTLGEELMLAAHSHAVKKVSREENIVRRFHNELETTTIRPAQFTATILSLQVERRTIAAAMFTGTHLDFTESLEVSSTFLKAEASTIRFLNWLGQNFDYRSAVLEPVAASETRRTALNSCARDHMRTQGLSFWEASKSDVAKRFGFPAPSKLREMRQIVCSIWPILNRIERLFSMPPRSACTYRPSASSPTTNHPRFYDWTALPYIGGKNRLANEIISLIPEHTTYVEPFAGGAQVLFHKKPSTVEVINDLDFDIVNFFRVCQLHFGELVRYLRFSVASRRWHELYASETAANLTDVQRAARFFYLQKNSFGGLVLQHKFHYGVTQPTNYNPNRIPEILKRTHERLARVQIESLPYEVALAKYDRPGTFFYIDPPYFGRRLYRHNFKDDDFPPLADRLKALSGKFILSLNDVPEVRQIFSGFRILTTDLIYTAKTNPTPHKEVLILNFSPNNNPNSGTSESAKENQQDTTTKASDRNDQSGPSQTKSDNRINLYSAGDKPNREHEASRQGNGQ